MLQLEQAIGGSVDRSKIGFQGNSELGYIYPNFFVGPNAAVPGTGQIIHTAGNLGFAPVSLAAWNTYYGIYVNDTFDITNRLSVTAGGRYNIAQIAMTDLYGTSPDLNGQYTFERFNPVVGFTYKILPELMTFYAGYSEANRAPTPLELGCSNPLRPCLLEGFLETRPEYESTYITLAKVYLATGQRTEGLQVLERLLQRNPTHPLALEIVRQVQSR